jgi:hypothetical protein
MDFSSSISCATWWPRSVICEVSVRIGLGKKQNWWKTDWNELNAQWQHVYDNIDQYVTRDELRGLAASALIR